MLTVDIAAGILFGILTGMGIGGGGLLVIYLTLVRNYSQIDAQGANLLFFTFAAAASMIIHFKKRNVRIKTVLLVSVFGIFGAFVGGKVTAVIPQEITGKLYGVMLVISGIITAVKGKKGKSDLFKTKRKTF